MGSGEGSIVGNRLTYIMTVIMFKRLRWACHVARMEVCRNAFKILTDRPKGKIPLGRPRCGWEDDIRMDLN
jgi:hypothetical protein